MAKIIDKNYTIHLSRIVKENDDVTSVHLTDEELDTLLQAVETIVDDPSVIVELE